MLQQTQPTTLATAVLNQYLTHGQRCQCLHAADARKPLGTGSLQPQPRLMHQRRRRQRVHSALISQTACRYPPQLCVDHSKGVV